MEHSLRKQAHAARELLQGTVCADGHAVAWYDRDVRPEPARYASVLPIWNDHNLPVFGPLVRSTCIMAAVRNATVPGGVIEANCAPFVSGRCAASLNGFLAGYPEAWQDTLRDWAGSGRPRGDTDGEWLFHAILARIEVGLANATTSVLRDAIAHAEGAGVKAQLNLLVTDGESLVAARAGTGSPQNSLYHVHDAQDFPGAHVVASEPVCDDPGWEPVPPGQVLVLRAGAPPVRLQV
jgi:glutamine amidotransferase